SDGTDGETVDDLAENGRVLSHFGQPRAGVFGRLVGEPTGALGPVQDDVAVAVEDVVDDLEEQPELVRERPPRGLPLVRQVGCPECHRHRRVEEAARLQTVHDGEVGPLDHRVEVLAADHPERRLRQLARDVRALVAAGEAERLREEGVACEHRGPLAVDGPYARLAAPLVVVVERRQVVVDEREVVHELDRERGRHRLLDRTAERLRDRERDDRTDALAAHLDEAVSHRLRLAVELWPELQGVERLLDEPAELVRTAWHRPLPPASHAPAPPRPPSPARTARRGSRAPAPATRSRRSRAGRARTAPPRAAPAAPPPG